jgi:hypothetical protein
VQDFTAKALSLTIVIRSQEREARPQRQRDRVLHSDGAGKEDEGGQVNIFIVARFSKKLPPCLYPGEIRSHDP